MKKFESFFVQEVLFFCTSKIWRIMKLTVFLLLLTVFGVMANETYSQSKKLSLDLKNTTVEDVLAEIEEQSEFYFLYSEKIIDVDRKVSIDIKNENIQTVLKELFAGTDVAYTIKDRIIVISTPDVIENSVLATWQQATISGTVTDQSGEPLPGVTIVVKGTTRGTVTDGDGEYSLQNVPSDATLVFSFVGMRTQEVEVGSQTSINVTLEQETVGIEEVVAIGYGTMRKSDLTGSVSRANIDDFRESPNVNITQSLQGTVPGLNIGQIDEAGENPSISIRGQTTLSGNQDVLIVVDGIIYTGSFSDLNPNDIESIDVLKDASSMAIYGAQAANGVILITTKQGGKSQEPTFNYSGSFTTQEAIESLTPMGIEEHIQKMRDWDYLRGYLAPEYTEPNPEWEPPFSTPEYVQAYQAYLNGENSGYDWWDNITDPGFITSHNLSISGTEGRFSYFIAGGYTKQEGIIINDEFERKTVRINVSNQILDWLKIGAQTFGSFSDYSGASPLLREAILKLDLVPAYDENGNILPQYGLHLNPFLPTLADDLDKRNSLFGNFFLDLDIPFINGLNYRLNYGVNYAWDRRYQSNEWVGSSRAGQAFKRFSNQYDWTLDHILTYDKVFADVHSFNLTLVAGQRELNFESTAAEGQNYNSLKVSYNDLSLGSIQRINSGGWNESYLYQTARLKYDFSYKYHLTATIRRDGFSGFAKNEKIGWFPSIGLGWTISKEPFLNTDFIQNLKLRASYGKNGNLTDRYASLARMNLYPAYVNGDGGSSLFGQQVTSLANNNLTWETTTGLNLGLDFSIINNRLQGSIDYYRTTTNNLLFAVNIPEITGFEEITTNVGEIDNRGIEVNLNGDIIRNDDFTWNLNFNIASNNNEIQSLIGLDADGDGQEDDLIASGLFIGESINSIFTYESEGLIQIDEEDIPVGFFPGTHRIADNNGDGFLDPLDRVIIGREEPAYRFGILNRLNYKNFELRFFINSVQGGKDGYLGENMPEVGISHQERGGFNEHEYWTPSNPDGPYRQLKETPVIEYVHFVDRSFVRLQDVTFSYTFNPRLVESVGIDNLKLFVSGKNLLTITDWVGWDPETGVGLAASGRPVLRGYSIGLDLSF